MIISRAAYNDMLDLINEQRHKIEEQQDVIATINTQILILKHNNTLLKNMLKGDPYDIDYPDVKGGKGAKTTMTDTNGNISF
jgi:hypothetical protein